jgi:predicted nucleotidyltransferase
MTHHHRNTPNLSPRRWTSWPQALRRGFNRQPAVGDHLTAEEPRGFIPWLDAKTDAYLRQVIALIAGECPDAFAVIAFGSVARHEERPLSDRHPSDVDLLVLFAPHQEQTELTGIQHRQLSRAIVRAYEIVPDAPRDVQVTAALSHFAHWDEMFVAHIIRDGILLWARAPLPDTLGMLRSVQ